MVIFPLAPDQTIAHMWSNGARGGLLRWYASNQKTNGELWYSKTISKF